MPMAIEGLALAEETLGEFSFREFSMLRELHILGQSNSANTYDLILVMDSEKRQCSIKLAFTRIVGFEAKSIGGGLTQIMELSIENISSRGWEYQNWEISDAENHVLTLRAHSASISVEKAIG